MGAMKSSSEAIKNGGKNWGSGKKHLCIAMPESYPHSVKKVVRGGVVAIRARSEGDGIAH